MRGVDQLPILCYNTNSFLNRRRLTMEEKVREEGRRNTMRRVVLSMAMICMVVMAVWTSLENYRLKSELSEIKDKFPTVGGIGGKPLIWTDGFLVAVVRVNETELLPANPKEVSVLYTNDERLAKIEDSYVAASYLRANYWPLFLDE
ncbi:MAG TPA: hypothetical protein P5052_02075 [Candidatus Paceibacterota bacterium]|nr:hypothetical protein [Candidatus Paceibacterota bacterium]